MFPIRLISALGLAALLFGEAAAKDVKFMMDWAWQGPQAFALVARNKGYFKEEGVNITLDRGFGSGRVPVELAAGTYQMGFADINSTIKFMAENPDKGLIAVAIVGESSPLVAVVKADGPIKTPKDLEGRTLAAPDFDAGRQLFPVFAKVAGFDAAKVKWISVKPELREPMLVQGQAEGITGFMITSLPALAAIGMPAEKIRVFKYKDYGAPLFSYAVLTTRKFADENPDSVKGVVRALVRGLTDTLKDPDATIKALKAHEPLTDEAVEKGRLLMTISEMIATDSAKKNGLSIVDKDRLQKSIAMVEEAYGLPVKLKADDLYTDKFLPKTEELLIN